MHFSTNAFVDSTFVGPKMVVFFLEGDLSRFWEKTAAGEISNPRWEKRRDLNLSPMVGGGHESKPSLRTRSEVAKRIAKGGFWLVISFPGGKWTTEIWFTRDLFSFQPFQVRHPKSPTKPPPPTDIPNLLPGFFRFRIRVVMLRGLIGRMDPIQSSCTLCVPSKRLGIWNLTISVQEGSLPAGHSKRFPFQNFHFRRCQDLPVLHRIFFRRKMWRFRECKKREIGQVSRWIGGWH